MVRLRATRRFGSRSLGLIVFAPALAMAAAGAHAQTGPVYRCAANDYTNTLTEAEAIGRHCTKVSRAEWVFSGSDAAGRHYTYNERRTVFRADGTVETWLQVAVRSSADADPAADLAAADVRTVSPQVIRCRERTVTSGATYVLDLRSNSVTRDSSVGAALFPPPVRVAETLIRRLCLDRRATESSLAWR